MGEEARSVLRPWRMELELVPPSEDASNARPVWSAALTPTNPGWDVDVPHAVALHQLVPRLRFHTHALGTSCTSSAPSRLSWRRPPMVLRSPSKLVTSASGAPQPVAVGFAANVDSVCLVLDKGALPTLQVLPPDARRAVRTSWFEAAVVEDGILRAVASRFSLGWIATLFLAALAGVAIGEQTPDLATTLRRVRELGTARCLAQTRRSVRGHAGRRRHPRGKTAEGPDRGRRRRCAAGEHRGRPGGVGHGGTGRAYSQDRDRHRGRCDPRGIPATGADLRGRGIDRRCGRLGGPGRRA